MTEREQVKLEFEELKVRKGSPIKVNGKEGEIEAITVEPPPGVTKRVIIRWKPDPARLRREPNG
jgi:hypothetical protein